MDPASRTEELCLRSERFPSPAPATYIIGSGNYNTGGGAGSLIDVHGVARAVARRWQHDTQLGHVSDLAIAMARSWEVEAANQPIIQTSTAAPRTVFRGLVAAAARAKRPDPAARRSASFDPDRL